MAKRPNKEAEMNKRYLPPERFYMPGGTNIYRAQEKRAEISQVIDFRELERKRARYRLGYNPRIKKLGKLWNFDIWLVDGNRVRNETYVDFTSGGHAYRYLYVPLNEIWIDSGLEKADIKPTIWHEFTERRFMARCWSYNQAHDYAARVEIGIRDGIDFILPVATFNQSTNYSCGAVALQIVFEYLGKRVSEKQLIRLAKTTPEKGTDPKDLASTARKLGFKVQWSERWTEAAVRKTLERGYPVIVNFQDTPQLGEGHYAVIIGYTKDEFIFSDPSRGEDFWKQKVSDFMKRWHELEDKTEREGIVIYR